MIKQLVAAAALAAFTVSGAWAQDKKAVEKKAPTAQQVKMKKCNADAKAKAMKGDERKKFMSTCLKG
jgi:hypothetical protein